MHKIKILVVTHKNYEFPEKNIYYPIHVGSEISKINLPIIKDNTGENISDKNKNYCELTALYWAWKNKYFDDIQYCGMTHYRRYFVGKTKFNNNKILSEEEILNYMKTYDIILPKKFSSGKHTVENFYALKHYKKDLDIIKDIIAEDFPEYFGSLEVLKKNKAHLLNMFICKTELFYSYCEWLFEILFKLEKQINIDNYDDFQSRIFGFLSERLFNVWLDYQKLKIKEIRVVNLEIDNTFLARVKRKLNSKLMSL